MGGAQTPVRIKPCGLTARKRLTGGLLDDGTHPVEIPVALDTKHGTGTDGDRPGTKLETLVIVHNNEFRLITLYL